MATTEPLQLSDIVAARLECGNSVTVPIEKPDLIRIHACPFCRDIPPKINTDWLQEAARIAVGIKLLRASPATEYRLAFDIRLNS